MSKNRQLYLSPSTPAILKTRFWPTSVLLLDAMAGLRSCATTRFPGAWTQTCPTVTPLSELPDRKSPIGAAPVTSSPSRPGRHPERRWLSRPLTPEVISVITTLILLVSFAPSKPYIHTYIFSVTNNSFQCPAVVLAFSMAALVNTALLPMVGVTDTVVFTPGPNAMLYLLLSSLVVSGDLTYVPNIENAAHWLIPALMRMRDFSGSVDLTTRQSASYPLPARQHWLPTLDVSARHKWCAVERGSPVALAVTMGPL